MVDALSPWDLGAGMLAQKKGEAAKTYWIKKGN